MTTRVLLGGLLLASCGEGAVSVTPPVMQITTGVPATRELSTTLTTEAPTRIDRVGLTADGLVAVSAAGRIYEVDGTSLVQRNLYADEDDPTELGTVHRLAPRSSGGAWIAAENGLFAL